MESCLPKACFFALVFLLGTTGGHAETVTTPVEISASFADASTPTPPPLLEDTQTMNVSSREMYSSDLPQVPPAERVSQTHDNKMLLTNPKNATFSSSDRPDFILSVFPRRSSVPADLSSDRKRTIQPPQTPPQTLSGHPHWVEGLSSSDSVHFSPASNRYKRQIRSARRSRKRRKKRRHRKKKRKNKKGFRNRDRKRHQHRRRQNNTPHHSQTHRTAQPSLATPGHYQDINNDKNDRAFDSLPGGKIKSVMRKHSPSRPQSTINKGAFSQLPARTKNHYLLPLQTLNSNILAWLPYNPNIQVSIQVVSNDTPTHPRNNLIPAQPTSQHDQTENDHQVEEDSDFHISLELLERFLDKPQFDVTQQGLFTQSVLVTQPTSVSQGPDQESRPPDTAKADHDNSFLSSKPVIPPLPNGTDVGMRIKWKKQEKQKSKEEKNRKMVKKEKGRTNKSNIYKRKEGEDCNRNKTPTFISERQERRKKTEINLNRKGKAKGVDVKEEENIEGERKENAESLSAEELVTRLADALEDLLDTDFGQEYKRTETSSDEGTRDACWAWSVCRVEAALQQLAHLPALPSCPCLYPAHLVYQDALHDPLHNKTFRWVGVSSERERVDVYRPGAHLCIRSRILRHPPSLASQTCCYNRSRRLVTRGSGAGTPALVSPQVSPALHRQVDILPWLACRGNFLRYQAVRIPNNARKCRSFPDEATYQRQVYVATHY